MLDDYYDTIIVEQGASRAVNILADECRKKDAAIETLTADLDRLRAVWRAVVAEMCGNWGDVPEAIVAAAVAAGLAEQVPYDPAAHAEVAGLEECEAEDLVTVLTPDGERLARGGDRG